MMCTIFSRFSTFTLHIPHARGDLTTYVPKTLCEMEKIKQMNILKIKMRKHIAVVLCSVEQVTVEQQRRITYRYQSKYHFGIRLIITILNSCTKYLRLRKHNSEHTVCFIKILAQLKHKLYESRCARINTNNRSAPHSSRSNHNFSLLKYD